MEREGTRNGEDRPAIGEVLDAVKAARHQFGTLAHAGGGTELSLPGLRAWRERMQLFLSDRRRPGKAAAAVIAAAAVLSLARGRLSVARTRHSAFALMLGRSLGHARRQRDRCRRKRT
jgi:hypothetical protein